MTEVFEALPVKNAFIQTIYLLSLRLQQAVNSNLTNLNQFKTNIILTKVPSI